MGTFYTTSYIWHHMIYSSVWIMVYMGLGIMWEKPTYRLPIINLMTNWCLWPSEMNRIFISCAKMFLLMLGGDSIEGLFFPKDLKIWFGPPADLTAAHKWWYLSDQHYREEGCSLAVIFQRTEEASLGFAMVSVRPMVFPKQVTRVRVQLPNLDTTHNCVPLPQYCGYKRVFHPRFSSQ